MNSGSSAISLALVEAGYRFGSGLLAPREGRRLFVARATLANVSSPRPVPVYPTAFMLRLASPTILTASPLSSLLEDGCAEDLLVEIGGSLECELAFEVPTEETPEELVFLWETLSANASIPPAALLDPMATACVEIADACDMFVMVSGDPCISCVNAACGSDLDRAFEDARCMSGCLRPDPQGGCEESMCEGPLDPSCCWDRYAGTTSALRTCIEQSCSGLCG